MLDTISPYAIDIAVTKVSNPVSIPLTVFPASSFSRLSKPVLPGTRIRTPGTMNTSGERRIRPPSSSPTTPIASAAANTPPALANTAPPGHAPGETPAPLADHGPPRRIRRDREHGRSAHDRRGARAGPERDDEGE